MAPRFEYTGCVGVGQTASWPCAGRATPAWTTSIRRSGQSSSAPRRLGLLGDRKRKTRRQTKSTGYLPSNVGLLPGWSA